MKARETSYRAGSEGKVYYLLAKGAHSGKPTCGADRDASKGGSSSFDLARGTICGAARPL